jgi:RHS repeat-associated protein
MMADVNGDGKADVVGFGADGVRVSFSAGDHFEDPRLLVDGYGFGNGLGPDNWYVEFHPRMMADVNGDGMADVVGFGYDGVYVSLSTGSGFTPLPKEPWVSNFGYDAGSWHGHPRYMADLNGDGKSDIVGFGDDGVTVSLSTGNGFIAPEIWINEYGYNDCKCNVYKNPRMIADVDGDGLSDVIGIGDKGVRVSKNLSARGHLIEKVETPSGARLEIEYANSSEYDSNPTYRRPPFIVHTVQKLKVDDGNGIIAETLFNYDGGYYDFRSREFRGFGKVGETKPNGTTTTNFYHSGDYNKDKIYRTDVRETAAEDSNFIRQTLYDWEVRDEGNTSFFVYLLNKTDELFDNGQNIASSIEDFTGYDAVGNILETEVQYWDKNSTFERITKKYAYNNHGSDSEPMWRTTMESLEGDVSGLVRQTYYRYTNDGRANLEERELVDNEGGNPVFKYQYDGCGNVTSETDARGNATETTYDTQTLTYPFTITYPQANGVKHIEINETYDYNVGKPTAVKDRNNQYTYIKYDVFGRIEQTDTPDGGQTVYIYDDHSFPRSMTERVKAQEESYIDTVTYFDGLDRKIQTASYGDAQKSIITQWQYDTMGRQEMVVGPFFGDGTLNYLQTPPIEHYFEHTTYDLRNRPLQIESPDGQNGSVLTEYSHDGLSTRTIDPDGYSKTETKDCLGRIIRVAEHSTETPDSTTKYEYNPADELVRLENTLGHVSTIAYDTLGRKISMTDPDMGHWRYAYDPNGNLKTQTDAESETTTFEYDELNRVTSKTYSSGAPSVKYVYDDPQVDNGIGRLTSVSNAAAAIEYLAYDPTGRIVEERKTISGEGAFTTRKTYDLAGKLIQHTFPGDNYTVEYHYYPGSNLLEKVIGAGDSHEYVYCSDYLPNGKMGTLVYGNGARTRYTYDPLSLRLTDINTSHNSNTLLGRSYQYKPSGDIWEITDGVNHITYTYTYDERHRLISETSSEPSPGFTPAVIELRYDDPEHIHAVSDVIVSGVEKSYSYDSNGNMTVGPDLTDPADPTDRAIYYNADNMPDEIRNSDGEITRFAYDGDNQRVTKQSPGGKKTLYIDDNYEVIDGVAHKYIFAGNLRVAMIKGSETYYFHKDHLGSSSVMTRQDGSILESGLYLPYGNQRGTDDIAVTGYKFTDQEHDGSTGLYNYGTRLYDPVIGRFISADNLVPDHFNPQALNRYAYVLNNPLKYVDPTGETEAETGMEYDIFETQYLKTDFWFLDISIMPLFNEANNLSAYFLNVFVNSICYLHDAEEWIITEALGGDPIDVEAFDAYMLFNGAALYEFSRNARLVRNIAPKSGAGLINTLKSGLRSKAGFVDDGLPIIVDNSLGVNPEKVAAALRGKGINARSVTEIFGKDPGDAAIKQLADQLGGKVLAVDRGRQLTGGFGQATIRVDGRVRSVDSVVRVLEDALK